SSVSPYLWDTDINPYLWDTDVNPLSLTDLAIALVPGKKGAPDTITVKDLYQPLTDLDQVISALQRVLQLDQKAVNTTVLHLFSPFSFDNTTHLEKLQQFYTNLHEQACMTGGNDSEALARLIHHYAFLSGFDVSVVGRGSWMTINNIHA